MNRLSILFLLFSSSLSSDLGKGILPSRLYFHLLLQPLARIWGKADMDTHRGRARVNAYGDLILSKAESSCFFMLVYLFPPPFYSQLLQRIFVKVWQPMGAEALATWGSIFKHKRGNLSELLEAIGATFNKEGSTSGAADGTTE